MAKVLNLDPAYLVFGKDSSPLNPEDYIFGKSRLVLQDTKKLTPADNDRSEVYGESSQGGNANGKTCHGEEDLSHQANKGGSQSAER